MPELPEVETVMRGLRPLWVGRHFTRVVVRRPDLRWKLPRGLARCVQGRRIAALERRAKYIICRFATGDDVLVLHLGMSGRLVRVASPAPPADPHDHVEFQLDDGSAFRFNDVRRFGMIDLIAANELSTDPRLAGLGPEPLSEAFRPAALEQALDGKIVAIKNALLDQRVVAGIGNIYACEALFQAGISPRRKARTIRGERAERLCAAIKDVLTRAIAAGGSSARDYVQASGELGWFQHQWAVYDREGEKCPGCACAKGIRRIVQGARSTFYCPVRQT
jgi:formamidopyrimidine-DNA glycosylase